MAKTKTFEKLYCHCRILQTSEETKKFRPSAMAMNCKCEDWHTKEKINVKDLTIIKGIKK